MYCNRKKTSEKSDEARISKKDNFGLYSTNVIPGLFEESAHCFARKGMETHKTSFLMFLFEDLWSLSRVYGRLSPLTIVHTTFIL